MPVLPPTERQQQILDLIRVSLRDRHYAPTVREIQEAVGIANPNGVMCHLRALKKKGLIEWVPGTNRTLQPTRKPWMLPLAGIVRGDGSIKISGDLLATVSDNR
jgi:repressor LexA